MNRLLRLIMELADVHCSNADPPEAVGALIAVLPRNIDRCSRCRFQGSRHRFWTLRHHQSQPDTAGTLAVDSQEHVVEVPTDACEQEFTAQTVPADVVD